MQNVEFNKMYAPSDDVVAREIEGELIIVPLVSGIGNMEGELYTLNETGKAIWKMLDGRKRLSAVIEKLSEAYEASPDEIQKDVTGITTELLERRMIIEV